MAGELLHQPLGQWILRDAEARSLRFNFPEPACAVGLFLYLMDVEHSLALNGRVVGTLREVTQRNQYDDVFVMLFLTSEALAVLGPIQSFSFVASDDANVALHGNLDFLTFRPCAPATVTAYGHLSSPSTANDPLISLAPLPTTTTATTAAPSTPTGAAPSNPDLTQIEQDLLAEAQALESSGGCQPPAYRTRQGLCVLEGQCPPGMVLSQQGDDGCVLPGGATPPSVRIPPVCPAHYLTGLDDEGVSFCWTVSASSDDETATAAATRNAGYALTIIGVLGSLVFLLTLFAAVYRRKVISTFCPRHTASDGQADTPPPSSSSQLSIGR